MTPTPRADHAVPDLWERFAQHVGQLDTLAELRTEDEDDQTYRIGRRDGFNEAVQWLDMLTGSDGEYRASTAPDRDCRGPYEMARRIADRLAAAPKPEAGSKEVREAVAALNAKADECRRHAEASFYPKACSEYRAKEAAFREAIAILALIGTVEGRAVEAYPAEIGRRELGERRSDGDRLCDHGHDVSAGHPLYWHKDRGQYDDSDPVCLKHAIEDYASEEAIGVAIGEEVLREALFVLSDRLRADGFLERGDHHEVYERVVAALSTPEER